MQIVDMFQFDQERTTLSFRYAAWILTFPNLILIGLAILRDLKYIRLCHWLLAGRFVLWIFSPNFEIFSRYVDVTRQRILDLIMVIFFIIMHQNVTSLIYKKLQNLSFFSSLFVIWLGLFWRIRE